MPPLVRISAVHKVYDSDGEPVVALNNVSLSVDSGEFLALMGPSGCGKSTLLHIIGAMDRPTKGEAWIEDAPIHQLPEKDLTLVRRNRVGFVFQFFHLLPTMTVEENVALPLLLANGGGVDHARVASILETVGLRDRCRARPASFPGANCRGRPWLGRLFTTHHSSSPTNRQGTWILKTGGSFWNCSAISQPEARPSSWPRIATQPQNTPHARSG